MLGNRTGLRAARLSICAGLAGTVLSVLQLVAMPAQAAGQSLVAKAPDLQAIVSEAAATGDVNVIVEFSLPPALERSIEAQSDAAMEAAVRAGQDSILADVFGATDKARIAASGARHVERMTLTPLFTFIGPMADLERLASHPRVTRIWPIEEWHTQLDSSLPVVGADVAHDLGWGGEGSYIAIIDTGVDRAHPFFKVQGGDTRVLIEACFSNSGRAGADTTCPNGKGTQTGKGSAKPCTFRNCDHGTHVAGIAAGSRPSGSPRVGVAPEARIIAVQAATRKKDTDGGFRDTFFSDDVIRALEFVKKQRGQLPKGWSLAAINMSISGGRNTTPCGASPYASVIKSLSGVTAVVVAAGNDGYRDAVASPGCVSEAITVGATTDGDKVASFSNIDATVDLLAPGVDITSSVTGGGFADKNGTSMAAPHVAGAFAVISDSLTGAFGTSFTTAQILVALRETGLDVKDDRSATTTPPRPAGTATKPRIRIVEALRRIGAPALTLRVQGGTTFSGEKSGPFQPAKTSLIVDVNRGAHIAKIDGVPAWLSVSRLQARVDPASPQLFELRPNARANALKPGRHTATLRFTSSDALPSKEVELAIAVTANSGPLVFVDTFDKEPLVYETTKLKNWTVLNGGTVDVVDSPPCKVACVDLDGLFSGAHLKSKNLKLSAGRYLLTYDLTGSQRGDTNTVRIYLGSRLLRTVTLASDADMRRYSNVVTFTAPATVAIRFVHEGADSLGIMLDRVALSEAE